MIEFIIKERVQPMCNRKGKTVYYALPKTEHTVDLVSTLRGIVERTSLTEGDALNTMVTLANLVCEAISRGQSVDLGRLGKLRVIVPSKMMDTPEEVTVERALNKPKIIFYPTREMLRALGKIAMRIDRG